MLVAATLPELLDDAAAWRFAEAGVPAVAGLRTGLACAAALQAPRPPTPRRLREMAGRRHAAVPNGSAPRGRWLAEHEAKALLRAAGIPVVDGRVVAGEDDAVAALAELGGPVAVKLSSPERAAQGRRRRCSRSTSPPSPTSAPPGARSTAPAPCSSSGWPRPAPS